MFKKISLSVAAILAVMALAKPPAASAAVIEGCRIVTPIVTPVHREHRVIREVNFHREYRDHRDNRFGHRW